MKTRLEKRLREAKKVLAEMRRTYGKHTEFYQDQLDYIAALEEHLAVATDDDN